MSPAVARSRSRRAVHGAARDGGKRAASSPGLLEGHLLAFYRRSQGLMEARLALLRWTSYNRQ